VKKNYFTATVTFDSQTPKSHQFTSRMDQYWIGLSSVLCPVQHSIGYIGDGFYRSKNPTNNYQSTEGESCKGKNPNEWTSQ